MQRRTIFNVVAITTMFVFATVFSASIIYAQQSSSPPAGSSLSSTTISPELKAKMCDPSNPSLKVANTTESTICGIPKTVNHLHYQQRCHRHQQYHQQHNKRQNQQQFQLTIPAAGHYHHQL
ncbi:MAG: hypothetical protein ACJ71A_08695 [Nitrososphaeraceae archaeon]